MARVIWSPQALADLRKTRNYFIHEAPAYAYSLVDSLFNAVERLETFPNSGRMIPEIGDPSLREVIYKGYRILHIVHGSEDEISVEVLSIVHSTRLLGTG